MLSGVTKRFTAALTALSVAAALVVSVFAQSHPVEAAPTMAHSAAPCADHMVEPEQDFWTAACESLCDASDLNLLLGVLSDRGYAPEFSIALPIDEHREDIPSRPALFAGLVQSHDPPGSSLYLTTQRLRL